MCRLCVTVFVYFSVALFLAKPLSASHQEPLWAVKAEQERKVRVEPSMNSARRIQELLCKIEMYSQHTKNAIPLQKYIQEARYHAYHIQFLLGEEFVPYEDYLEATQE